MFEVVKNGDYVGYINISTTIDSWPVTNYTTAQMPLKADRLTRGEYAIAKALSPLLDKPVLLYLGGYEGYLFRFKFRFSKGNIVISIGKPGRMMYGHISYVSEEELSRRQANWEKRTNQINPKAREAWNSYLTDQKDNRE